MSIFRKEVNKIREEYVIYKKLCLIFVGYLVDYRPKKTLLPPPWEFWWQCFSWPLRCVVSKNFCHQVGNRLQGGFWGLFMTSYPDFRKYSNYPTICPLGGQKLYILLFFQQKNIFPRLWRHMRGKIAVFAPSRPCHVLIGFPVYLTTRWPKMAHFTIFSWKTYFPTIMTS